MDHGTAGFHGRRPRSAGPWTAPPAPDRPPDQPSPVGRPVAQHVWYFGGLEGRQPALLVGWRSIEGRWDGLICTLVPDDQGHAVVQMWVDSQLLAPCSPSSGA